MGFCSGAFLHAEARKRRASTSGRLVWAGRKAMALRYRPRDPGASPSANEDQVERRSLKRRVRSGIGQSVRCENEQSSDQQQADLNQVFAQQAIDQQQQDQNNQMWDNLRAQEAQQQILNQQNFP